MRILVIMFTLMLSINLQAEWKDEWIAAVEKCQENDYVEADFRFSKCISEIESTNDKKGSYVYVDRARLYLLQNRYAEALDDLNIAINSQNLEQREVIRALVSRICAKTNLGITEGVLEDLTLFRESLPAKQEIQFTKKHIIIRNTLDCECFKNIVSNYLIKAGYCKSVSDIKMNKSGTWIIERSNDCNCGCSKINKNLSSKGSKEPVTCEEWCDYFAIAGSAWCGRVFKRFDCQVGCLAAVEMIKRHLCYPCCKEGKFYENCIKPFEDIVSYMGKPCDPMWD